MRIKLVVLALLMSLAQAEHSALAGDVPSSLSWQTTSGTLPGNLPSTMNSQPTTMQNDALYGNLWQTDLEVNRRHQGESWKIKVEKHGLDNLFRGKGWCQNAAGETGVVKGTDRQSVVASIKQDLRNLGCQVK